MKIVRCKCGWFGRETEIVIPDHCPHCQKYGDLEICDGQQEYSQLELRFMWEQFSDIPIGFTDDDIQDEFLGFHAGTDGFDIWHWFDERYVGGVYALMEEAGA